MEMILKLLKMIIKKKKIENENQKKIVLIHIILANLQLYVFDYVENILFIIYIFNSKIKLKINICFNINLIDMHFFALIIIINQ